MIPGEIFTAPGDIEINAGRPTVTLTVANTGDRPIQVGSHYHFYETNAALAFDREQARGFRLDIPAGTATRFEPGQSREVRLVAYAGERRVVGFNGQDQRQARISAMATTIPRDAYAAMFGPTTGDRLRLADTELVIEIESDRTIYGEEVKFGGGKVIRDGMGQGQATRAEGAVDTVITNAVILDHWGIVKADIGIRDGRISGIGKAGNPDIQPGVDIVIGPGHRSDRRRGPHRHRRRHRLAHPLHLPAAGRGGALQRHHDDARRRHRPGRRHRRDDLHARALASRAGCCRRPRACRSISASSARAMLRTRGRWSRWSRPAPAD